MTYERGQNVDRAEDLEMKIKVEARKVLQVSTVWCETELCDLTFAVTYAQKPATRWKRLSHFDGAGTVGQPTSKLMALVQSSQHFDHENNIDAGGSRCVKPQQAHRGDAEDVKGKAEWQVWGAHQT